MSGIARKPKPALLLLALLAFVRPAAAAEYVIHVSVDGLNASELRALIDDDTLGEFDNFERLIDEGASTFNARSDYDYTDTIPNHVSMTTGRPVSKPAGAATNIHHNYTSNDHPGSKTIHNQHPDWPSVYVSSAFDVAHDNGLSTALYASKSKFVLFDQSYDATNGAPDGIPPDDGADKIDVYVNMSTGSPANASNMHAEFLADMAGSPTNYTWVHYRDPDSTVNGDQDLAVTSAAFCAADVPAISGRGLALLALLLVLAAGFCIGERRRCCGAQPER